LGSGVQEVDDIFGETEAEKALIRALLREVPDLTEKEAKRVLSEDISEEEVEQYLPIVKECIPEAKEHGTQDWKGFWNI
jgi:hypothetical protein